MPPSDAPQASRLVPGARYVGAIAAAPLFMALAWHAAVFLRVSLGRMSFPFEVEFMEGLTIDYARTVAHGGNLYGPASASFAPLYYPPLYYLVALPALVLGSWSLLAARLVSWLSFLLTLLVLGTALRRSKASWTAVAVSVAVALAYYPDTLYWYDLARVDSLQTLLQVAGLTLLVCDDFRPSRRALLWSAGLLTAAVYTKQTAAAGCASALLWLALARDWRRLRVLTTGLATLGLLGMAILLAWFGSSVFVVFAMPARHARSLAAGFQGLRPLATTMAPLVVLALAGVRSGPATRALRFWLLQFGAALAMAFLALCKHGGLANSAMPAIILLGACVGLGYDSVVARLTHGGPRWVRAAVGGLVAACLFVPFRPDYERWIPTAADRADAEEILADMRALDRPFLAYNHSFVSTVMRGEMYPSWHALWDWAGGEDAGASGPDPSRYPADLMDRIRARGFPAIYTNGSDYFGDPLYRLIKENYRVVRVWPLRTTGAPVRWMLCVPRVRWEPKPRNDYSPG